jgi:hypothetical protein
MLQRGEQFMLHWWLPLCYSNYKPGDVMNEERTVMWLKQVINDNWYTSNGKFIIPSQIYINRSNPAIFVCPSHAKACIPDIIYRGLFFVFSRLRWEVIVRFVDIWGIVDHHRFNFSSKYHYLLYTSSQYFTISLFKYLPCFSLHFSQYFDYVKNV